MTKSAQLLRWLPFIAFALYIGLAVGLKDRGKSTLSGNIRPEAAANCERICNRMAACALESFGDNESNRAYLPRLKDSCFSGCLQKEARVSECFKGQFGCFMLAQCTVHFLQQSQ
ncbi:MAG: Cys-rich protein [Leptospirales bacterium]|jgi:Cys-rich protein (TIGR04453 family)